MALYRTFENGMTLDRQL